MPLVSKLPVSRKSRSRPFRMLKGDDKNETRQTVSPSESKGTYYDISGEWIVAVIGNRDFSGYSKCLFCLKMCLVDIIYMYSYLMRFIFDLKIF